MILRGGNLGGGWLGNEGGGLKNGINALIEKTLLR